MVQVATVEKFGSGGGDAPPRPKKTTGFVYFVASMAVIGGFLFGYDTGVVSSAMLFIPDAMNLDYLWTQLVVSITVGTCAIFSFVAGASNDKLGRKPTIMIASALFTIGAVILAAAQEKYTLLVGRFVIGAAVGLASTSVPPYLSEACPAHLRGRMVTGFQLMVTFGFFLASVLGAGFSYIQNTNLNWRLMMAVAGIPSVIMFVGFIFLPESPRWLMTHDKEDEARRVIKRIYGPADSQWVEFEVNSIKASHDKLLKEIEAATGDSWPIVTMLKTPHLRKALMVGCLLQGFQQLAGVNTLMFYTASIIKMSGIRDDTQAIWMSCAVTGVNFLCTFVPIVLIERLGRRKLLLISMIGVLGSLLLLGGSFLLVNQSSPVSQTYFNASNLNLDSQTLQDYHFCKISNCDTCVTYEKCGFCFPNGNVSQGVCLPTPGNGVSDRSAVGVCSNTSVIDVTTGSYSWNWNFCPTSYGWITVIGMVCYLCAFSTGLAPVPWVMNTEIYPNWARSTGTSCSTATNWIFNLIISQTFLTLTETLTKYGAFFLYATITIIGFIVFYFTVPETKGLRMEEVEMLFMSKQKAREFRKQQHQYFQKEAEAKF